MTEFLINTPSHKRWMLPDGRHYYNTVIFGCYESIKVIERETGRTKQSVFLDIRKENWQLLSDLAQKLAEEKYKRPRYANLGFAGSGRIV